MTNVVDFRDREVCQFIKVNFAYGGLLMMTSSILQMLTFATICCDPVTYTFLNKWNEKRIHESVATRDRFEMIHIKIGTVEHTLLLICAQDIKCPKTGQASRTLINMNTQ
jgi:hypothetical protein